MILLALAVVLPVMAAAVVLVVGATVVVSSATCGQPTVSSAGTRIAAARLIAPLPAPTPSPGPTPGPCPLEATETMPARVWVA